MSFGIPIRLPTSNIGFDENYYLSANPDVAALVQQGVFPSGRAHYEELGRMQGREPLQGGNTGSVLPRGIQEWRKSLGSMPLEDDEAEAPAPAPAPAAPTQQAAPVPVGTPSSGSDSGGGSGFGSPGGFSGVRGDTMDANGTHIGGVSLGSATPSWGSVAHTVGRGVGTALAGAPGGLALGTIGGIAAGQTPGRAIGQGLGTFGGTLLGGPLLGAGLGWLGGKIGGWASGETDMDPGPTATAVGNVSTFEAAMQEALAAGMPLSEARAAAAQAVDAARADQQAAANAAANASRSVDVHGNAMLGTGVIDNGPGSIGGYGAATQGAFGNYPTFSSFLDTVFGGAPAPWSGGGGNPPPGTQGPPATDPELAAYQDTTNANPGGGGGGDGGGGGGGAGGFGGGYGGDVPDSGGTGATGREANGGRIRRRKRFASGGLNQNVSHNIMPWDRVSIDTDARGLTSASAFQVTPGTGKYQGYAAGGLSAHVEPSANPVHAALGTQVRGPGTGRSDEIPALLSNDEYVIPADVVAALGDGSSNAGAKKLRELVVSTRNDYRKKLGNLPPPKA